MIGVTRSLLRGASPLLPERGRGRLAGAVCSEAAAVVLLAAGPWPLALLAALVHVGAARLAVDVAGLRADLSRAERDLVWLLAIGVPVLGVLFGWRAPRAHGVGAEADAHEAFEAARAGRAGGDVVSCVAGSGVPRSLALSGGFDRDVRARLDVESHLDVLRFGDRTLRANLVHKLAERGAPRDLALLRRVLEDPEEELRIQAVLQLREARNRHVANVAGLVRTAQDAEERGAAAPEVSAAWVAAARGHLELAESGALDPALVAFELQRALTAAQRARPGSADSAGSAGSAGSTGSTGSTGSAGSAALACELRVLARLGALAEAQRALAALGDEFADAPELLTASAEVAFCAGDFGAVRASAARLEQNGCVVPEWMATVAAALGERSEVQVAG